MCRNIRTLFNFEPPATEVEIRDASLQFVLKLSVFNVPAKANEVHITDLFSTNPAASDGENVSFFRSAKACRRLAASVMRQ